jgi:hypothetical protein
VTLRDTQGRDPRSTNRTVGKGGCFGISSDRPAGDLFLRLTIDNTAETIFGLKMNCLRSGKQPLFASAFDEMQILCLDRFVDPLFEIKRFFQLGHQERRIRHLQSVLDLFCKGIVHHLFTREAFFSSPNHRHEFTSFWLNGFQDLGFSSLVASF